MKISKAEQNRSIQAMDGRKTPQLRPQFEPLAIAQNPKDGTFVENWVKWKTGLIDTKNVRIEGHIPTTVLPVEKPYKEKYNSHLTVKPVLLLEGLIRMFTIENQAVLDPFVGSGTTLLAARDTGRIGIGMEINGEYYKIAPKRLIQ